MVKTLFPLLWRGPVQTSFVETPPPPPSDTGEPHGGGRRPNTYGRSHWAYGTGGGKRIYDLINQRGTLYAEP